MAEYLIQKLADFSFLPQIGKFRWKTWKEEGVVIPEFSQYPNECWIDELDYRSHHWVITKDTHLVAAARLSIHQSSLDLPDRKWFGKAADSFEPIIASFNRLVVNKDHRQKGLSRQLDRERLDEAQRQGVKTIVAIAVRPERLKSLTKMGFEIVAVLPPGHGLMTPETAHTAVKYVFP